MLISMDYCRLAEMSLLRKSLTLITANVRVPHLYVHFRVASESQGITEELNPHFSLLRPIANFLFLPQKSSADFAMCAQVCLDCHTHFRGTDFRTHTVRLFHRTVHRNRRSLSQHNPLTPSLGIVLRIGRSKVPGSVVQREAIEASQKIRQDFRAYVKDAAQSIHRRCSG